VIIKLGNAYVIKIGMVMTVQYKHAQMIVIIMVYAKRVNVFAMMGLKAIIVKQRFAKIIAIIKDFVLKEDVIV
jgi:hypothetical protein